MEIINKPNNSTSPEGQWKHHTYLGVALIIVGTVWILRNFNVISEKFFDVFFSWQMLLVVIGGYLLTMKKWVAGIMVTLAGAIFVATDLLNIHISFNKVVLPLACIMAGFAVILTRKQR